MKPMSEIERYEAIQRILVDNYNKILANNTALEKEVEEQSTLLSQKDKEIYELCNSNNACHGCYEECDRLKKKLELTETLHKNCLEILQRYYDQENKPTTPEVKEE